MIKQQAQTYHHFQIETLVEGVYAAIALPEGAAVCNAGVVDLGDRTLIFDTFSTIGAAQKLREAAEAVRKQSMSHLRMKRSRGCGST